MKQNPFRGRRPTYDQIRGQLLKNDAQIKQQAKMLEGQQRQIEYLTQLNRELDRAAKYERKTGCIRRDYISDAVAAAIKGRRVGDQQKCAVVYVDIDGFKAVNDTYGHPFGDSVLRRMAEIMIGSLRHEDLVARGDSGDEFIIFINRANFARANRLMLQITGLIAKEEFQPFDGSDPIHITVAYGVAERNESASTFEQMAEVADKAMYEKRKRDRRIR